MNWKSCLVLTLATLWSVAQAEVVVHAVMVNQGDVVVDEKVGVAEHQPSIIRHGEYTVVLTLANGEVSAKVSKADEVLATPVLKTAQEPELAMRGQNPSILLEDENNCIIQLSIVTNEESDVQA
jgi:hypothetical protein